ncbi:MFS transporter, DHA1 family, multidrug resistance protein, partial [Metarhizium majus ARSEF 297]
MAANRQEATSLLVEEHEQVILPAKFVDFVANDDADDAVEWSASFQRRIVALLALAAFTVTFNCISIFPVANTVIRDLNGGNATRTDAVLVVTIWELGEAAGPLVIAPLSEMFGRYPVYVACHAVFFSGVVMSALAQNTTMFIAARAVAGMAVASNVLNPAIIGDMFPSEQRGSAMSIVMLASLVGGNLGPLLGGVVSQTLGWRAVLRIGAVLAGICGLLFLICFRETYTRSLDEKRVGVPGVEAVDDAESDVGLETSSSCLLDAVLRPARLLLDSGVLVCLSLFGSVVFALFYVVSVTLPGVLEGVYGLSEAETGLAFLANGVGSFIGIMLSKMYLDKTYIKLREANNGIGLPEYRLPVTIIGAVLLPLAVALYGWCAANQLPLMLLLLSVALMRLFPMLAFVPLMTYIVDAFGLYSASAMSGVIVIRCLACVLLPLATVHMSQALGHGWGCTLLGAVCMMLALIPMAILRYGQHWRQRCRYTSTFQA